MRCVAYYGFVWCLGVLLVACEKSYKNVEIHETNDVEALYSVNSLQVLQSALDKNPNDTEILYQLALWNYHKQEFSKAQNYLQKCVILEKNWKFYLLLSKCLYRDKKAEKAKNDWLEAYKISPKAMPVLLFGLELGFHHQDSVLVGKLIDKMEKNYPKDAKLLFWRGKWAGFQGDTLRAFAYFNQLLRASPTSAETYKEMSLLYNRFERPRRAVAWANAGLQIRPAYDSLWLQKAIAFDALKENDSALYGYEQAYKLNKKFYTASYYLGIAYWKAGKYQQSIAFLESTQQQNPNLPKLYYFLANSYEALGRNSDALAFYKKSINQEPENLPSRQGLYALQQKIQTTHLRKMQDSLLRLQVEQEKKRLEELEKAQNP